MKAFNKIEKIWSSIELAILGLITLVMSVLLAGNAVSRYLFNKSWGFSEEVGSLALVAMTFLGIGYAVRKKQHIEMSGFYDLLPKQAQWALRLFIDLVSAIVLLFLTYLSYEYVLHLHQIGEVTTMLQFPVYLIMAVMPIGFFIAFLSYLVDFIKGIYTRKENDIDAK